MLYRLVVELLQPLIILCLAFAFVANRFWWKYPERRKSLVWLCIPWIGLYLYTMPVMAYLAAGTLEWQYPPSQQPPSGETIIVLGAGVRPPDSIRRNAILRDNSIHRCLHAAKLYRSDPTSLVVVSGGKPDPTTPGPTSADVMREFLVDLGVPSEHLVVQRESRTTYEDAVYVTRILRERDIQSVRLVTDAIHLPRSLRCFQAQGIHVTPSGCRYCATSIRPTLSNFLPHADAVKVNGEVFHEWLGFLWYWVKGRI